MNDPKEPGTSIPDYSAVMLRSLAVFLGMIQAEEGMSVMVGAMVERGKYCTENISYCSSYAHDVFGDLLWQFITTVLVHSCHNRWRLQFLWRTW